MSSKGKPCKPCKGSGVRAALALVPQHSSESNEHFTPLDIVEASRLVLGAIDLDPASCTLANETVKAAAYYGEGGEAPDGLVEPWCGRVFLNPPGGDAEPGGKTRSNAARWWGALASAWEGGDVEAAIFVGFTLEILRSAQALDVPQPLDFPICIPRRRIPFDTLDAAGARVGTSSPTHANVIVYLPPRAQWRDSASLHFADTFATIGRCRI